MKNKTVIVDNTIRQRIIEFAKKKYGDERGWKVKLQKALGLSSIQQLSNTLTGSSPIGKKFLTRMENIGADRVWLETGLTKKFVDQNLKLKDETQQIPLYKFVNEKTNIVSEDPVEYISTKLTLDKSEYSLIMSGDSMKGEFNDGDVVIASELREIERNKIVPVVLKYKNEILVRFCKIQNDFYIFTASNQKYEPFVLTINQIKSIHRVVRLHRKF